MASTNISFRTPPELMTKLASRDIKNVKYPGHVAKRDVDRWYSLLESSLGEATVSPEEAVVIIFAASWWLPVMTGRFLTELPAILRQEIGLDGSYAGASRSLADRMESWPLAVRAAVWDAAERYDVTVRQGPWRTYGAALHQVGLHNYRLSSQELALVEALPAVESRELPAAYLAAKGQNERNEEQ